MFCVTLEQGDFLWPEWIQLALDLILYALILQKRESNIYLLSIKHHRQLSFDFNAIWDAVL